MLVVSPSSLMCQWAEVFEDWIEGLPYDQINIVEKRYFLIGLEL